MAKQGGKPGIRAQQLLDAEVAVQPLRLKDRAQLHPQSRNRLTDHLFHWHQLLLYPAYCPAGIGQLQHHLCQHSQPQIEHQHRQHEIGSFWGGAQDHRPRCRTGKAVHPHG